MAHVEAVPARERWTAGVVVTAAIVVAVLLYRPWQSDPLPIRDFSGTIALLSPSSGVMGAYEALMDSYALDGRFQPAFMFGFAAQWSVFGASSVGWQIIRFVLMTCVVALAIVFAVRCGATWPAAAAAMTLWLIASNSHEAWFLLQIAEPFAALFVIVAAILATRWRSSPRPLLIACGIATALLTAVLSKETMIAAVPFVIGLALCRDGERWTIPEVSGRSALLISIVAVAVVLFAIVPISVVRSGAAAGAYASRFELGAVGVDRLSNSARAILLPVTRIPWFPANVLFGAVGFAGWTLIVRGNPKRAAIAATVLLAFPVAGILLYAAWPGFPGYYAMPFALSVGTMLALALTALSRRGPLVALSAFTAVGVVGLYGTALAWNGAQTDRAIRRTDWAAVQMVARLPEGSRIVVGVPDPKNSGRVSLGLSLYATAVGAAHTPVSAVDVACGDADLTRPGGSTVAVVLFSNLCGAVAAADWPPAARAIERYVEIDWKTFRPHTVENTVSLWVARPQVN